MKKFLYVLPILVLLVAGCNLSQPGDNHPKSGAMNKPSPAPTASNAGNKSSNPGWVTYSNPEFHFAFSYPPNWKVDVSTSKPEFLILLLNQDKQNSLGSYENLRIDVYKNSKPQDADSDSDAGVKYNAELKLAETTWKVFNEPLHPTKNTIPIYRLQTVRNSNLYSISTSNQTNLTETQTQVVAGFQFQQ